MAKPLFLYTSSTPNWIQEELKAAYGTDVIDLRIVLSTNRQKEPWFIALNPNGRIPVLVDRSHEPSPFTVFESACHLALSRSSLHIPTGSDEESELLQWIFFAHGAIGPMQGQAHHFRHAAPEDIPYGKKRYTEETARLYGVLNIRLEGRDYLVGPGRGKLTIADLNAFPWVRLHQRAGIETLDAFPNVQAWLNRIAERPAVKAGLAIP
ncbi:glutathione S-transferase [Pisolithus microcarpus]|nr:glutathione S-transferase [Pisolithus microcarpus]